MNINLTVLVQVVHFFIAYLILTRLVLKPTLAILNEEESLKDEKRGMIATQQNVVASLMLHKQQQWYNCFKYFKKNTPNKIKMPTIDIGQIIKPVELNRSEKEDIAQILVKDLKAKILR